MYLLNPSATQNSHLFYGKGRSKIIDDRVSTGRGVVLPAKGLECARVSVGSRPISRCPVY
jgi:hypothetical protein